EEPADGVEAHERTRSLPLEPLGIGGGFGKPEARAVVVGDGETHALGREGKPTDRRGYFDAARLAGAGAREGVLAGRPGNRTVRAERDVIDPAALRVLPDHARLAGRVERDDLAVVAAGDETRTVARARQDAA